MVVETTFVDIELEEDVELDTCTDRNTINVFYVLSKMPPSEWVLFFLSEINGGPIHGFRDSILAYGCDAVSYCRCCRGQSYV
jgi:hypothetical protein